jgi:hypothetical protein
MQRFLLSEVLKLKELNQKGVKYIPKYYDNGQCTGAPY